MLTNNDQPRRTGVGRAGRNLSVRALLTGAAMLAAPAAHAAPEEQDFVPPRLGSALPQPLPPSDAARLRRIFVMQDRAEFGEARAETAQLDDRTLIGHVLSDRYLNRRYHVDIPELATWLDHYRAQGCAAEIRALLRRRLADNPAGAASIPPALLVEPAAIAAPDSAIPEEVDPLDAVLVRSPSIDRQVAARLRTGDTDGAIRLVRHTRGLNPAYGAQLRAEIARSLFLANHDEDAASLAGEALHGGAPNEAGLAGYVAGLANWRLGRTADARSAFEASAGARLSSPATRAAAAFWAARANLRTNNPGGYAPWMIRAAEQSHTFYGLLARRMLGRDTGLAWKREIPSAADLDAIVATDAGRRAFALLQIGQTARAEAEFETLLPAARDAPGMAHALALATAAAAMPALSARYAEIAQSIDGRSRDTMRFPVPRLRPRNGFRVEPSLVYALTRLESNFDAAATSAMGARGLMQVMPVTAGYITGRPGFSAEALHDPGLNLDIGQSYVAYLARQDAIDNNLIYLLAAYNAGPANLQKFRDQIRDEGDPLMFIEAIPNTETRRFAARVLSFSWIYAARLNLATPTLDQLARGAWPTLPQPPPPARARAVTLN